mgnify:FL=1
MAIVFPAACAGSEKTSPLGLTVALSGVMLLPQVIAGDVMKSDPTKPVFSVYQRGRGRPRMGTNQCWWSSSGTQSR